MLVLPKGKLEAEDVAVFDREKIAYLMPPFTRSDLRTALRNISGSGTASLFHKAVFLDEKDLQASENFPQILIADDNEVSARILNDYLEADGFRVLVAHDGADAIQKTREFHPNLILMDIQMPGMDGFEAIRRIRADEAFKDIPILAVTALAMPGDRERSLEVGANGYISKPVVLRHLLETIHSNVAIKTGRVAG
jgi:CheY-like chemotaxis protein